MQVQDDVLYVGSAIEWITLFIDDIVDDLSCERWYINREDHARDGEITSITLDCPIFSRDNISACAINWAIGCNEMTIPRLMWTGYDGYVGIRHTKGGLFHRICEKYNVSDIHLNFSREETFYKGSPEFELVVSFLTSLIM